MPVINLLFTHGVRAALEYSATGDLSAALARTNPEVAPHLPFLDMSSHGFATLRVTPEALETEFVGMDRPLEPVDDPEGPPVKYRLVHRVAAWEGGSGRGCSASATRVIFPSRCVAGGRTGADGLGLRTVR